MGANKEGARLVAKAWKDPAFKVRLLENGNAACLELGIIKKNISFFLFFFIISNFSIQ